VTGRMNFSKTIGGRESFFINFLIIFLLVLEKMKEDKNLLHFLVGYLTLAVSILFFWFTRRIASSQETHNKMIKRVFDYNVSRSNDIKLLSGWWGEKIEPVFRRSEPPCPSRFWAGTPLC
jgi:hypothetical protein